MIEWRHTRTQPFGVNLQFGILVTACFWTVCPLLYVITPVLSAIFPEHSEARIATTTPNVNNIGNHNNSIVINSNNINECWCEILSKLNINWGNFLLLWTQLRWCVSCNCHSFFHFQRQIIKFNSHFTFPILQSYEKLFFCIIIVFISLFVVVVCVNHLSYDWFVHNSTKYCICNQVLYTTSMMIDSTMFYLFLIAIEKYQTWDTKLLFFSFRLLSLLLLLSYNLIFKTIIMELGWKTNVTLLLLFKLSFETRWNDTIFATFN